MNLSRKLWTGLGLCLCLGACKTSTSLTQIRLSLSKGYLYHPDSVEVRWQAEGVQEVSIEGVATGLPPTGSKRLYFDETSNYKVVAKNEKESTARNINVPIRIFTLQVKADTLLKKGDMSTLSWKAPYAQRVSIRGVDEQLPASGKMYIEPTTDTTFHFEAYTADGHITEKEVTIRVIAKDRFWVSKPYLHTRERSAIHWNFPDATQIKITSEVDDTLMTREPSGSFMSTPLGEQEAERKYLLNVEKKNGEVVTQKLTLKKIIPYLNLQARPEKISKGDKVKLRWNTRFIKDISLNGVAYNLPSKGEIKVTPLKKTIYQLSGIDDQGERHSTQVTVGVHYRKYIKGLVDINQLLPQTILFEITQVNLNEYPKRVTLRVIAVDTAGNFVSGLADSPALQQRYFSRLVETVGKQRKIQDFSVKEVNEMISKPYAINLTLDYSGSMSGAIGYVEQATQALIVKKHKQDVMSIVKFDDQFKTITPLAQEEQKLLQSYPLRGMRGFGGGTALYASIDEGLRSLDSTNYNRTMILLTDGQENSSFVHQATHAFRASQVVKKSRAAHVPMQIIALGNAPNQNIIDALAYLTGGYAYFAQGRQEVEKIYQEMSR
ncbi:MAG: vWA domain-containing protein, partial [Bacteroidota bacterium]